MCATFASEVEVGSGRYALTYRRRAGELVVHFRDDATEDDMRDVLVPLHDRPRHEDAHQLEPLKNARKLWAYFGSADDADLRTYANNLQDNHLVKAATPVYEIPGEGVYATPMPGEMVIRIATGSEAAVEAAFAGRLEPAPRASEFLPARDHLFRVRDPEHPELGFDWIEEVRHTPGVLAAEHDWLELAAYQAGAYPRRGAPNDPAFTAGRHWNLTTIRMDVAAPLLRGKAGARVWVLDSGFDLQHEDLKFYGFKGPRLDAERLWNGDDGDLRDVTPRPSPGLNWETVPHGTCVAGIIGAVSNNERGVTSVAGSCGIVPIRLGAAPTSGQLAVALGWAAARTDVARVVNMSLTAVATMTLVNAVEAAAEAGLVLCAAAGNAWLGGRGIGFPARHPRVLGVGAIARDEHRCGDQGYLAGEERWESRYGEWLDVVAPGLEIPTTDEYAQPTWGWNHGSAAAKDGGGNINWLGKDFATRGDVDGKYFWVFSGTSSSTPHVSGLASLLLAADPSLTADAVRGIIIRTCRMPAWHGPGGPCPFLSGAPPWSQELGFGIIDVARALKEAPALATVPAPAPIPDDDACAIEDVVILEGWLGLGWGSGWRVYHSPALDVWTEVDEADIIDTWSIPGGEGASRVVVRRGAALRRVETTFERAEVAARPAGR